MIAGSFPINADEQVIAMPYSIKATAVGLLIPLAVLGATGAGANDKQPDWGAGEKLTASEIKALVPGEFEAVWKESRRVTVEARADGVVHGSAGMLSDSGRWSIRGDQLCIAFKWWTGNKTRCTEVMRDGGWYFALLRSNGKPRVRFRPQ